MDYSTVTVAHARWSAQRDAFEMGSGRRRNRELDPSRARGARPSSRRNPTASLSRPPARSPMTQR